MISVCRFFETDFTSDVKQQLASGEADDSGVGDESTFSGELEATANENVWPLTRDEGFKDRLTLSTGFPRA